MNLARRPHSRPRRVALAIAGFSAAFSALFVGGFAFASGSPSNTLPVSSAQTPAWTNGKTVTVQYAQDYFCDRTVTAVPLAASGCEVGAAANVGPVANADRSTLYVVIPLFPNPNPPTMCPTATGPTPPLNCPNHPQDIYVPLAGFGDIPLPAPTATSSMGLPAVGGTSREWSSSTRQPGRSWPPARAWAPC
jgi:hypothetical protein